MMPKYDDQWLEMQEHKADLQHQQMVLEGGCSHPDDIPETCNRCKRIVSLFEITETGCTECDLEQTQEG